MKKLFNIAGLLIGILVLGTASYVISGWEDPFVRPADFLKSTVNTKNDIVQIAYPDKITIDSDFENVLKEHRQSVSDNKIKKFVEHLKKTGEYVITPSNNDVFRAIIVKDEGKGALSFSVYIKAIIDSRETEVVYRLSGFIEQFPIGPVTVERAERTLKGKIDVPLDFYYKNKISLWDFSVYAALESGPCCN